MIFGVCRLQLLCLRSAFAHYDIAYYFCTFRGEMYRTHTFTFAYNFESWARKNTTFGFTGSSCCFRPNKNVLETKETKHTDSQLHFAPKNIKIHLVVFENELSEDAMLVPKKFQNWKPMFYSCIAPRACMIRWYMSKTWVFSFGTFLELAWHLQSTRSRRLLNRIGWFLVQNEAESLLVLFLLLPAHFCWVERNGNCQGSKKLCFFLVQVPKM